MLGLPSPHVRLTAYRRRWARGMLSVVVLLLFILLSASWTLLYGQGDAPAIANQEYPDHQVMAVIGHIGEEEGAPLHHASAVPINGYVMIPYGESGPYARNGMAVYDLRDPRDPVKVGGVDGHDLLLAEQHAVGFHVQDGRTYAAVLAVGGIELWDWTDLSEPARLSRLELPGVRTGYSSGAWWLAWQAPYLYVGGTSNGLYIVDTADPADPFLVDRETGPNPLPVTATGGFRVGPVFAVGNLLVLTRNDGPGYATMDISDPRNPVLLDVLLDGHLPSYSSMVNGNRIYAAGIDNKLHVLDIGNPHRIAHVGSLDMGSRGGYLTVQDGFAHVGASHAYVKIDVRAEEEFTIAGTASSAIPDRDEDFAVAVGNLVLVGDDHGNGTHIIPHQAGADRSAPTVTMVSPADGALNQPRTSRIGLTFSDQIDMRTIRAENIIVRPVWGAPLTGRFSYQTGILNFWPDEPLTPDTAYEIIVPAGGLADVAGNPIAVAFRSSFATGGFIDAPITCTIDPVAPAGIGRRVEFRVRVTSSVGATSQSWDFGDDSPLTPASTGMSARHTYAAPGHFTVRANLFNELFRTGCAAQVTVHQPVVPGHAATSSTILFDPDRARVWNVNPDNDSISVISAVTHDLLFERQVGRHPRTLAQAPDGTIWVVNQDDATIYVLEPEQGARRTIISLPRGTAPYGVLFTPDGRHGFVTLQATGELLRLDPAARAETGRLYVGPTPRGLSASHVEPRLFVSRYISPDAHGEVYEVQPDLLELTRVHALAPDPGPDTEASGRGLPNGLASPALTPDGRRLWIPSKKDNIARGLQRDGQPLTFESTVRPIVSQLDLVENRELTTARIDFNDREGPVAVRFTPLGDYAFVLMQGSATVEIVDVYSGQPVTAIEKAGMAPQGLVLTSDGTKLFVHSWLTRSVLVYDVGDIIRAGGDQTAQLVDSVRVVAHDRLSREELLGKQIFYHAADPRMSLDGYISCASCHLDGGHDGRTWDRTAEGEGLRNTIDLRTSPPVGALHWSANFDEVQDFEQDMRLLFGGSGFLADSQWADGDKADALGESKAGLSAELDALARYVASLARPIASPHRTAEGGLTPEGETGRMLFRRLGCAGCHGGVHWSDSATGVMHNLGTIGRRSGARRGGPLPGIDTPPLLNLWQSAPYLHDGSAPDLRAALLAGVWHGDVAGLDAADMDALIAFLLQIDAGEPPIQGAVPAVDIVRPLSTQVYGTDRGIELAVNTATGLERVARVLFYVDGHFVAADETPIYATVWPDPAPGAHRITALLDYANGVTTFARPVEITVE